MKHTVSASSLILRGIQEPFVLNTFEFCTIRENKLIVINFLSVHLATATDMFVPRTRLLGTCTLFSEANDNVDRKRALSSVNVLTDQTKCISSLHGTFGLWQWAPVCVHPPPPLKQKEGKRVVHRLGAILCSVMNEEVLRDGPLFLDGGEGGGCVAIFWAMDFFFSCSDCA